MNGIPTTDRLRPVELAHIPYPSGGRGWPYSSPSGRARRTAIRNSPSSDHAILDSLRNRRPLTHLAPPADAGESCGRLSGRQSGPARRLAGMSGTQSARGSACGAAFKAAANSSLSLATPKKFLRQEERAAAAEPESARAAAQFGQAPPKAGSSYIFQPAAPPAGKDRRAP
jgi:hypothetical protein